MNFKPPINERSDKELFNIILNDEKWIKDIQILAEEALLSRGYSSDEIQNKKSKRVEILGSFHKRKIELHSRNRMKSYSWLEMILTVLTFPLDLFRPLEFMLEFSNLKQNNYRLKLAQKVGLSIVGLIFWVLVLRFFILKL